MSKDDALTRHMQAPRSFSAACIYVNHEDDEVCRRGWDRLVKEYGYEDASRGWRMACQQADAQAEAADLGDHPDG